MLKRFKVVFLGILAFALSFTLTADEGMYPLSEISRLNLKAKGLKIDIKEIYNPNGVSLVDAICEVGGGTGEFVSQDGLILTNHHIAFSAVAVASTPEHDYLKNGFVARTRDKEIPAKDYTCLITEAYKDISSEILEGVKEGMPPAERSKIVREKMKTLAEREEAGRVNIRCEVSEMFPGKSYVLFTYRQIKDVRLVYVPPIDIGNFGGEEDNWVWPRHTGDFSFLRAYVAPDGKTAAYSKDNIPYKPKRFIKVSPKGVRENDFVMILGYPGRTNRHKTSHYLELYEDVILPYISKRFDWMISTMEATAQNDRALQLKFASAIKSYANVTKNYKGKMQGLRRLSLVQKKVNEERALQKFIENDPKLGAKYGNTLAEIGGVYNEHRKVARQELTYTQLMRNKIISISSAIISNAEAKDRTPESVARLKKTIESQYDEMHIPTEIAFLSDLLFEAQNLPAGNKIISSGEINGVSGVNDMESKIREYIGRSVEKSLFKSKEDILEALSLNKQELTDKNDPILKLVTEIRKTGEEIRERQRARDGELNRLEADLLDVKMLWQKKDFIPDANSTLRLTYGYVRGYSPADATRYSPITTLRGIIEKHIGEDPYNAPQQLLDLYYSKKYSKAFEDETIQDVPVAILYNMDTTGGNSGSPVLNAKGELVGVNFDRAFEATINDYQWSEDYSRSIGVDIRYVLFIAKYLGGADFLLKELGVNL